MISSGNELRNFREAKKISQARLAEITGISQHVLSAFELEKSDLSEETIESLNEKLRNIDNYTDVLTRKKRYKSHQYSSKKKDSARSVLCAPTPGNREFLSALNDLAEEAPKAFTGVSLFSGCGGFSLGFKRAGCDIKAFVEIDDGLSGIYAQNFPLARRLGDDVSNVSSSAITDLGRSESIDVLIGGPPCQGFSLSGKRDVNDPRNVLFEEYMRFVDILRPKAAVIENVRLLTSMKSPDGSLVRERILASFEAHGYSARLFEVNAKNFGVPQHRERVFFIAVRQDLGVLPSFPSHTHGTGQDLFGTAEKPRTFGDACSDLAYLESGESSPDPFHKAVNHPDHVIHWLWDVQQGASAHDNEDPSLRPPSGYNTTYKRQVWDEPASTVQTTFGMISGCRNVHPVATRSLTIREAARIQTFPDSFQFEGSLNTIRTGIGNAVPPLLARIVGEHVRSNILDLVEVTRL